MTTSSPAREVSFQASGPRCHWTIHIVILIQLLIEAYLWCSTYHEFKDRFEEHWLKRVQFQSNFALFPCLFTLGLNGRSISTRSSSSSLLALDFKLPFSLHWSFDGKSSLARISSLINWSRFANRNVVWQTMNKDVSPFCSRIKHDSAHSICYHSHLKSCCLATLKCTLTSDVNCGHPRDI